MKKSAQATLQRPATLSKPSYQPHKSVRAGCLMRPFENGWDDDMGRCDGILGLTLLVDHILASYHAAQPC
jgi:hypothetical protein